MKFKYNFLENRLWKLAGEYSSQISENNQFHTPQGFYGTNGFHLGEKEWITFTFDHTSLKVCYQQGTNSYQKILDLPEPNNGEIIFELTEQDLI